MKMHRIPVYREYKGEKRIALMDNSSIAFLERLECCGVATKGILLDYDVILVPNWVLAEVKDSFYRIQYLQMLLNHGCPIRTLAEEDYGRLANWEEGHLYKIVYAAVSTLGVLKSYLRRNVEKEDPLDMEAYSNWIMELYRSWPLSDAPTNAGRVKKKNAGEISLTILAEVLAFYYPSIDTLTVYTQDRDTYDYQNNAHKQLKRLFNERLPVEVGFKSNDCLLSQMYRSGIITLSQIVEVRSDARIVTYTKKRDDESVTLITKRLNNLEFTKLIENEGVHIIF